MSASMSIVGRFAAAAGRLERYRSKRGLLATVRFVGSRLFRRQLHVVYEADCGAARQPVQWAADERLLQFGPDNLDGGMDSRLNAFLGGKAAFESLDGVRRGDRLFVIAAGGEYVHRGYILFNTRQKTIIGESANAPLIANCATAAAARGRGLYKRALAAELDYLQSRGYRRVIIETAPENTASRRGIEGAGFSLAWQASVWILLNRIVVQRIRDRRGTSWRMLAV